MPIPPAVIQAGIGIMANLGAQQLANAKPTPGNQAVKSILNALGGGANAPHINNAINAIMGNQNSNNGNQSVSQIVVNDKPKKESNQTMDKIKEHFKKYWGWYATAGASGIVYLLSRKRRKGGRRGW